MSGTRLFAGGRRAYDVEDARGLPPRIKIKNPLETGMSFTLRLAIVLVVGIVAAAIISPLAAWAVAALGYRFPFERIFDRTVMVTVLVALIIWYRRLRLTRLLQNGFRRLVASLPLGLRGLLLGLIAVAALVTVAAMIGARGTPETARLMARVPGYVASAFAIAIIEEAFFRAIVLGGMIRDFGRTGALVASSAFYSITHLVRAPAHHYLTGLHPAAGFENLAASCINLTHPAFAAPLLIGLFLLGLVLGEAYLLTGNVYLSIGLHAGLVIGMKSFPMLVPERMTLPHWLVGYSHLELVSGAAAWVLAVVLFALLRPLAGVKGRPIFR